MTSTDVIKYSDYPPYSTNDTIKRDKRFEEFASLVQTIKNIRDKKNKYFIKIHKIGVDHTYEIDDPILIRHFLLEIFEEINDDLIKNNKPYRISFGNEMFNRVIDENESYLKKKVLYDDNGTFNSFKLEDRLETLDKMVRSCSFNNQLFLNQKK